MHSVLLVIENLNPGNQMYDPLLEQTYTALKQYPEIIFLSKNVLLLPNQMLLLATSCIETQCRTFQGHAGQNFGYKCLFLEEEPTWICSKEILQKQAPQ